MNGRTVMVTGASSGIGKAVAVDLAYAGAAIVGIGRDRKKLDDLEREIQQTGSKCLTITADVTDEEQMKRAVAFACDAFGAIDGAVLSAGINIRKPAFEMTVEEFRSITRTNIDGVFISAREIGRTMTSRGGGSIVTVSSLSTFLAYPNNSAYCASKAAVTQLTKVLAMEWAPFNIRVNAVCPGRIATPLISEVLQDSKQMEWMMSRIPAKRLGKPEDVAAAVRFLLSQGASYVTGTTLTIDGGWSANP
jgi:NAD(P)-dependent dehydrogenase (short-subunit alcohol dehydrogenase family)